MKGRQPVRNFRGDYDYNFPWIILVVRFIWQDKFKARYESYIFNIFDIFCHESQNSFFVCAGNTTTYTTFWRQLKRVHTGNFFAAFGDLSILTGSHIWQIMFFPWQGQLFKSQHVMHLLNTLSSSILVKENLLFLVATRPS